jgi:type IX secretion system PorP/SprF family membrane protein
MKKAIIFLIFSIFFTFLNAQQLPHYSMYMLNEVIINPAALSKEKNNKATLMLRDQWSSFEGAPSTQSISYSHLNHKKYKRGISIINDVTGPISIINATFSRAMFTYFL